MGKKRVPRLVGGIITILLLGILIFSGPAQAFTLGLEVINPQINEGEIISFMASIEIDEGEFMEIDHLILKLEGPSQTICKFDTNGTIISGCNGIFIDQISSSQYNYGYGFGEGIFEYNITLNSSGYLSGFYETFLNTIRGQEVFSQQGDNIIIRGGDIEGLERCSIRAKDGSLNVGELDIGDNNDLNFYLSEGSSGFGQGSLTGQKSRKRLSYKFDVLEVIENNNDRIIISVSGNYKINRGDWLAEDALIFFDRIDDRISLVGENIELIDSDIQFREMC